MSELIYTRGGFISEYTDFVDPKTSMFRERLLQRDRLIAGLSDVFLAFECSEDSATVDAAKRARNLGVDVYAIQPDHKTSRQGVDQLIDEGIGIPLLKNAVRRTFITHQIRLSPR